MDKDAENTNKVEIPDLTGIDITFGNIKHLPNYDFLPADFKRHNGNKYVEFIAQWFFVGRTKEDMQRLNEKSGIDRRKALVAIKAILASFEPKHQHKEAGAAYLLSQWFDLD